MNKTLHLFSFIEQILSTLYVHLWPPVQRGWQRNKDRCISRFSIMTDHAKIILSAHFNLKRWAIVIELRRHRRRH